MDLSLRLHLAVRHRPRRTNHHEHQVLRFATQFGPYSPRVDMVEHVCCPQVSSACALGSLDIPGELDHVPGAHIDLALPWRFHTQSRLTYRSHMRYIQFTYPHNAFRNETLYPIRRAIQGRGNSNPAPKEIRVPFRNAQTC